MKTLAIPFALVLLCLQARSAHAQGPVEVEPADLAKRADLVGKEVVVDDRVRIFYPHQGRGIDEIHLKRTPVIFRLPPDLRYPQAPTARAVRLQGILRKEGDVLVCDVTELPLLYVDDVKRVDLEAARLKPDDLGGRVRLAEWATHRGRAFRDEALLSRGEALASEAFAMEQARASSSPDALLVLARRARERKVPEPQPSALAHRAFLLLLAQARTIADFDRLADEIVAFFPSAKTPAGATAPKDSGDYAKDPGGFYRNADDASRAALDRRLWTDCVAGSLRLRAAKSPREAMALAEEARKRIPDRPEIATELRTLGFEASARIPPSSAKTRSWNSPGSSARNARIPRRPTPRSAPGSTIRPSVSPRWTPTAGSSWPGSIYDCSQIKQPPPPCFARPRKSIPRTKKFGAPSRKPSRGWATTRFEATGSPPRETPPQRPGSRRALPATTTPL